jgi:Flp pilus assembly protein TadG
MSLFKQAELGRRGRKASPREKGASLYVAIASLVFIVLPMAGLTVDVGYLYSAKARLQASVDGAALAAARALNLGQTITQQEGNAEQNAVNWFYGNFPPGTWLTNNTIMNDNTVSVFPDPTNAQLAHVNVTATTTVPTFFLKWLNIQSTTISAVGDATRRSVVAMLVLDRSGSMCNVGTTSHSPCAGTGNTYPCTAMVSAAKQFSGSFAENRDYMGLISFAENAYVHSVPTQTFQTTLGYSNTSGSSSGAIDTISCSGGTSTAAAMSMAYQLLWQTALPGALNMIMLETDGLPNSLTMNFWDSTNSVAGLAHASNCTDTNGKTMHSTPAGFGSAAVLRNWTPGLHLADAPFKTVTGGLPDVPAGMIGTVSSTDPSGGNDFFALLNFWSAWSAATGTPATTPQNTGNASFPYETNQYLGGSFYSSSALNGCSFPAGSSGSLSDLAWFPQTDIFGNQVNPSYNPSTADYQTVSVDGQGHALNSGWSNFHAAVLNATENAAYRIRNGTLSLSSVPFQPYIFAIGLAGNSTIPPDPVLLQRIANDPNGDTFNVPADYPACASATNCYTFTNTPTGGVQQPQGRFVYSPSKSQLNQAFLAIASQVLRLSH